MTDKQIIIDVTQCPYYKEDKTCTYLPYKSKCEGDCNWTSYKEMEEQLKAKEQECEKLKKDNNCFQDRVCKLKLAVLRLTDDNDLLKAENNELEKAYARLNSLYNDNCNFTGKLEQTLTEIKEIVEKRNYLDYNECLDDILQKISECEVENEN